MIFTNHCDTFFQQTSSFLKFSVKKQAREILVVQASDTLTDFILFYQNLSEKKLIYPEVQAAITLVN